MTITPVNGDLLAGIANSYSETIAASPDPFITGDVPALFTTDELVAVSQTLAARTVVGFNGSGALVEASYARTDGHQATGVLTFSGVGTAADTVTIGDVVYTLVATPAAANEVKIGASATLTGDNLAAAINGSAGEGTNYGTGTIPHPTVTAINAAGVVTLTARAPGSAANDVPTTESGTGASFAATKLSGGINAGQVGVQAIGVLVNAVTTGGGDSTVRAAVYRGGVFNPSLLTWGESFDTDEKKRLAFHGAPSPTAIVVRAPATMTVA